MLFDVLYTVLSTLPVISHVAQLFLEPYAVSQVLAFFEAFPLSPDYSVHPFLNVDLLLITECTRVLLLLSNDLLVEKKQTRV